MATTSRWRWPTRCSISIRDIAGLGTATGAADRRGGDARTDEKHRSARELFTETKTALAKIVATPEGKAFLARIDETLAVAAPLSAQLIELAQQNKNVEATELLMKKFAPAVRATLASVDEMIAYQTRRAEQANAAAAAEYRGVRAA